MDGKWNGSDKSLGTIVLASVTVIGLLLVVALGLIIAGIIGGY